MRLPTLTSINTLKMLAMMLIAGLVGEGCAVTPVNLTIKDSDQQFAVDTILSTTTREPVSYDEMLADLAQVQVVFVGEVHTNAAHHDIQARIIQALQDRHAELSVGMEMFDHRYDPVLAQWSAGDLDRETFIQKTHWYVRRAGWGFDFELYAPIFETIRENRIRLVGLNVPGWIPSKISRGGLDNLLPDERALLAETIDTENEAHRAYAENIFNIHPHHGIATFDYFYEAQCAWEDTMAQSIVRKMGDAPMVVVIGNGHIIRKFGVPDRVHARNQASLRTVYLAAVGSEVDWDYADYIWVTPQVTGRPEG
ncbi:MAG: ChaN family lipoprotein [Desulfobacterales bacterium]|nr:ChaN family lipoprotein [Desulfobacterales bacterium]MDJ0856985.1 ChaN family lipoprotein [Desulfobacterales bacterium]MDJ0887064.1 ChaN family lipoprotein [Desulfobacterales bacterium]